MTKFARMVEKSRANPMLYTDIARVENVLNMFLFYREI